MAYPGFLQADVGLALLSGFGNANVDAKNQEVLWGVRASCQVRGVQAEFKRDRSGKVINMNCNESHQYQHLLFSNQV